MLGAIAVGDVPRTDDPATTAPTESTASDASSERTDEPSTPEPWDDDVDGWLADTPTYDGSVVDATGGSTVTVRVGAGPNGLAFDPPAVRVSPGTTVRWEWTGEGGSHDVHAVSGASFESRVDAEGDFEWTAPDEPTTVRYECRPHTSQGERGVVVVE
jgi:halocyanin-like protein